MSQVVGSLVQSKRGQNMCGIDVSSTTQSCAKRDFLLAANQDSRGGATKQPANGARLGIQQTLNGIFRTRRAPDLLQGGGISNATTDGSRRDASGWSLRSDDRDGIQD